MTDRRGRRPVRMLAAALALISGLLIGLVASPLAAQSLPSPQYPIVYVAHEVLGDGSTPNGGTPPGYATRPPAFAETVDPAPWITHTGVLYAARSGSNVEHESKARFTCADAKIGVYDAIRGPGQEPFGHGHNFFGNKAASKDSGFTSLRRNPDSTCAGGMLNGSSYWSQWVYKDGVFAPGKPLVKRWDYMNLYYVSTYCYEHSYDGPNRCQPIPRGFQTVFGFNMDDGWAAFKALVAKWSAAHPALGTMTVLDTPGTWKCAGPDGSDVDGSYGGSPWRGSGEQPYLANPDGSETLRCPAGGAIVNSINMPICWDGRLAAPNGFSNLRPVVTYSSDGQGHCPNHWYRLPSVKVFFRYSHQGPADYRTWKCSSDPAGSAAAGRTLRPCESTHTDYQFGWHEATSDKWQGRCLGITINGVAGTPADCDYGTISPTERLISDGPRPNGPGPLVDIGARYTGAAPGDWFVPSPAQQGPFSGHAGMAH